jgi:hypothetical protein
VSEADLLAVRFETTFVAIPIGEDGIDYQATGIRLHLLTAATPRSLGPTTSYRLTTHLPPGALGCRLSIGATFRGPLSPPSADPAAFATAHIGGPADGCTVADSGSVDADRSALRLTVAEAPAGLTVEVPQTAFGEDARYHLDEGAVLPAPLAWTEVVSFSPRIDATRMGADFVVGSDMPADVPCTKRCPPA